MTIPYISIFFALLLIAVPAWLLWRLDQPMLRSMGIAVGRMVAQLAVVALITWLLWHVDEAWLSLLWLLVMTVVTAFMVTRRAHLNTKRLILPVGLGIMAGTIPVGAYVLLLVIRPDHPFAAQWLIPVGGVLLAHVLATTTPALSTYFETLRTDSLPYYTAIGNGEKRMKALLPYAARAMHTLAMPTAANLATTGLFALPLLLSGLLMGGLQPIEAAAILAAILIACVAASMLTLIATIALADRYVFDRRGQLINDIS